GTYSTAHSVHLTREAHELGVDAVLVVTPYYNKPPARGIVEHFKAIAAVSDRPIVVYNIPSRVVINIEPETIAELAEIPTVRAVTNPIAIKAALNLVGQEVGGLRLPLVEASEDELAAVRDCLERAGVLAAAGA